MCVFGGWGVTYLVIYIYNFFFPFWKQKQLSRNHAHGWVWPGWVLGLFCILRKLAGERGSGV